MLIRELSRVFDPIYLKPKVVSRALAQMGRIPLQQPVAITPQLPRTMTERRQQDRRQRKTAVLLDLRCSQARRRSQGRRDLDRWSRTTRSTTSLGIDVYA